MSSSLVLMFVYTVVVMVLQALAIGVIILIEPMLAGYSGIVFMAAFFVIFWFGWTLSVRLTEPKDEGVAVAQASRA
jgi:hypothetical protein